MSLGLVVLEKSFTRMPTPQRDDIMSADIKNRIKFLKYIKLAKLNLTTQQQMQLYKLQIFLHMSVKCKEKGNSFSCIDHGKTYLNNKM